MDQVWDDTHDALDKWLKIFLRFRATQHNLEITDQGWIDLSVVIQFHQLERPDRMTEDVLMQKIHLLISESRVHNTDSRKYEMAGQRIRVLDFAYKNSRANRARGQDGSSRTPPARAPLPIDPTQWVEVLGVANLSISGTTPVHAGDLLRVTAKIGDDQGLSSGILVKTGARFQIPRGAWSQITEASIHSDWAGLATARACNICDNFAIDMISVCCGTPAHILCWQGLCNKGVHTCPRCHKRTQATHQGSWHSPQQHHTGSDLNRRHQPAPKRFPRGPRFHDFDVESDDPSSSSSTNWKVCETCDRYLLPHNSTGYCRTCWEQVRGPDSSEASTRITDPLGRCIACHITLPNDYLDYCKDCWLNLRLPPGSASNEAPNTAFTDTPCSQCNALTSGLQGEGTGEYKGEFFCSKCWTAWYSAVNIQNTA